MARKLRNEVRETRNHARLSSPPEYQGVAPG